MASFLASPAAKIVGAGMQAMGIGIPVNETSAKVINGLRDCGVPLPPKNWFKTQEKNGGGSSSKSWRSSPKKNCYDKLEAHIHGMLQVARPAMELKNLIKDNCCKSAERLARKANDDDDSPTAASKENLKFYTPQKCKSSACAALFQDKSASPKKKVQVKKSCETRDYHNRRNVKSCSSEEEEDDDESFKCCMCTRAKNLIKLPCGLLICSKCDKTGDHDLKCKQCKKFAR